MQFEALRPVSWYHEMLPDFVWIDLMLGRRSAWGAVYAVLDVVDRFVPRDSARIADGRLSSFAAVPESARAAARAAVEIEAPGGVPAVLPHILGMFPESPAAWLVADRPAFEAPDRERAIAALRAFVAGNADRGGVRSTRLRMVAISRLITHGRFLHAGGDFMDRVPRYPTGLNASEQRQVESVMRATWNSRFGMELATDESSLQWAQEFWTRVRELTPCVFEVEEGELPVSSEDGPVDPEPALELSELRALLTASRGLGNQLRAAQLSAFSEPESDPSTSVLFGMAARMYRLMVDFLERPSCWNGASAPFYLRPLVETRIVSAWLSHRDDPELIQAYREHGIGNLKLLREHIKADLGTDPDADAQAYLEHLDGLVNLEIDEWFQPVNVGAFSDATIRKMAIECDLKKLYDLVFVPMSADNHGEWPSVRDADTTLCTEPLHRSHRVGTFATSSRRGSTTWARMAIDVGSAGIVDVFAFHDIDVASFMNVLHETFDRVMYSDGAEEAPPTA